MLQGTRQGQRAASTPRGSDPAEERAHSARGVLSMELVLTLPILGVVLLGLFEFTLLLYARGQLAEASRAGARQASLPGTTEEDVELAVARVLPERLQRGMTVTAELGDHSGDVVAVAVSVPMTSAAPDLLWPIGVGLSGRWLMSETRMIRE
jgi:hypothetical protein